MQRDSTHGSRTRIINEYVLFSIEQRITLLRHWQRSFPAGHIVIRSNIRSQDTASCIICRIPIRHVLNVDRHDSIVLSAMSKRKGSYSRIGCVVYRGLAFEGVSEVSCLIFNASVGAEDNESVDGYEDPGHKLHGPILLHAQYENLEFKTSSSNAAVYHAMAARFVSQFVGV